FARITFEHTELYPKGRMGSFSRLRLQEATLEEIFHFAVDDLGLLVPISARIEAGVPRGANTTYTLTVKNDGELRKGLTAEGVTIALALAPGTAVVTATGSGYQGVRKDPQFNSDAVVWQVTSIAPQEEQTNTLTIAGAGRLPSEVFKGSVVR